VRLAFGIATSLNPDILVIDEIIGTVDNAFLQKARQRLSELIHRANIVFLASHDQEIISRFCNKVLLLQNGEVQFYGEVDQGLTLLN
jgi:ABC-2 type transport system ATP-binding protein/lipopolysaccharide transport system ATP-binding protein